MCFAAAGRPPSIKSAAAAQTRFATARVRGERKRRRSTRRDAAAPSHLRADEGEARLTAGLSDGGNGNPIASASLIGRQLADVSALLSPFGASLRNAFLVFSREGMLVHSGLYDEQVYVAVPAEKFTSFQWAPPATTREPSSSPTSTAAAACWTPSAPTRHGQCRTWPF